MKRNQKSKKRLQEIEDENRKKVQQIEEQNRRKQHLIQNIDNQMEDWFKSQKLLKYAEKLEAFVLDVCCVDRKK